MKKWLSSRGLVNRNKPRTYEEVELTDSFLLIEGLFPPAEAADILLSLLNNKIKFHTVQLLNLKDMNQSDFLNSEERIKQLREAKNKITNIILDARNEGKALKIHSTIEITKSGPLN